LSESGQRFTERYRFHVWQQRGMKWLLDSNIAIREMRSRRAADSRRKFSTLPRSGLHSILLHTGNSGQTKNI
jgi:protein-disulfide isomerase-like protein with CxxC motif